MQQKKVRDLARQLAIKYKMSPDDILEICKIPFEFAAEVMSTKVDKTINYFPTIRITGFGVFYVKPGRRKFLENLNNKKNEKQISENI